MYRQYVKQLELRPKTTTQSKPKKNKRRRRNSAPVVPSSNVLAICYGPEREKKHSSKRDKRVLAIESGKPDKPKSANKDKEERGNRSGSPKNRDRRDESKSPERKPDANERRGTVEEINTAFHVTKIDWHVEENTTAHHTDLFQCTMGDYPDLVVRRGQSFKLTITFDRKYEKETHDLFLCLTTGRDPKPQKGTAVTIEMDEDPDGVCENLKEWYAKMVSNDMQNCQIVVEITPPVNCFINEWEFNIETSFKNKPTDKPLVYRYECKREITILLNPWCPHDQVHYPNPEELEEYILNESGCVYQGNYNQINDKGWDFGQFSLNNLEICLHLIRRYFCYNIDRKMSDPVYLSRAISAEVNSSLGGILEGNWSGNYEGGKKPWKWQSSTTLLQQYDESGEAVKYAQCWVFSAVTTTVCRAIGIPCRSVTNFASAHDTDGSLAIDQEYYFDTKKKKLCRIKGGDSIWNFHVWNECWMSRPDLGKSFDGWQAVDATPQELSDCEYRCGPASVAGIKRGEVQFPHDTPFVFAEVNGDIRKWERLSPNKWRLLSVLKSNVGKKISTKFPDGKPWEDFVTERLDITHEYKFPEGSEEERAAVQKAGKDTGVEEKYKIDEDLSDILLTIDIKDGITIGNGFDIRVCAKNVTKRRKDLTIQQRSIDLAQSTYDGIIDDEPFYEKTLDGTLVIPYMEEKEFTFPILYEDYEAHLTTSPYCMAVSVEVNVQETGATIMAEEPGYRLRRPDVKIDAPKMASRDENVEIKLTLQNPFKKKLTNCTFSITGNKLKDIEEQDIDPKYIRDDGSWEQKVTLTPTGRKGIATIAVDFDSDEIQDVGGNAKVILR